MLLILEKTKSWCLGRMTSTCVTLASGVRVSSVVQQDCVSGDYVYVTEYYNNRVSVFLTSGEFVHSFGEERSGRGELKDPYGIAIDRDGFVFVCDIGNNRIQVF